MFVVSNLMILNSAAGNSFEEELHVMIAGILLKPECNTEESQSDASTFLRKIA